MKQIVLITIAVLASLGLIQLGHFIEMLGIVAALGLAVAAVIHLVTRRPSCSDPSSKS